MEAKIVSQKWAIYARVSTATQEKGLEAQVRALKEFCEKKNIHHYELFTDENISGAKASRPGLDRMMNAVRNKEFDTIVVYSFSRYARSTTHLLTTLEELRKLGVNFISLTESIDLSSPMGRAFFTVIAAISQLEREILVERVKNGLKNARAKGVQIGRKKTRPSNLIRTLYHSGMTYREIARIAKCSQGAVSSEIKVLKKELAEKKRSELESFPIQDIPQDEEVRLSAVSIEEPSQPIEIVRYA